MRKRNSEVVEKEMTKLNVTLRAGERCAFCVDRQAVVAFRCLVFVSQRIEVRFERRQSVRGSMEELDTSSYPVKTHPSGNSYHQSGNRLMVRVNNS